MTDNNNLHNLTGLMFVVFLSLIPLIGSGVVGLTCFHLSRHDPEHKWGRAIAGFVAGFCHLMVSILANPNVEEAASSLFRH